MPLDLVWLFTVPVDGQPAPAHAPRAGDGPHAVPVGHWAGDRVLIADTERGLGFDHIFPPEVVAELKAEYPNADHDDVMYSLAPKIFTHIYLPVYEHAGAADTLFPVDRVWVLRNLTKGWYARADSLLKAEDILGPTLADRHGSGLGDLLWADIGGAHFGMESRNKSHFYGMGDRFDIQPLSTVQNPEDGREWHDASEEAKCCLSEMEMELDLSEARY